MEKPVKELLVTVSYTVRLTDVNVPEKALQELRWSYDCMDNIQQNDRHYPDASKWLMSKIGQPQHSDHEFEIVSVLTA